MISRSKLNALSEAVSRRCQAVKPDDYDHLTPARRAEAEALVKSMPDDLRQWDTDTLYRLARLLEKDHVPQHGLDEDLFPECTCANCRNERSSKERRNQKAKP